MFFPYHGFNGRVITGETTDCSDSVCSCPPTPCPGAGLTALLFADSNTPPWETETNCIWHPYMAPSSMKIKDLILQLCPASGPDGKEIKSRGIAECVEQCDGNFVKLGEYWVGEKGADEGMRCRVGQELAAVGWTETRATPVRLACLATWE
jgi:hypothetical protein